MLTVQKGSIKMLPTKHDVRFTVATPWLPSSIPLVYHKELVHIGTFTPSEDQVVTITDLDLQHWVDTFREYQENGLDVPIYVGHVELDDPSAPEKRRGHLEDVWIQSNKQGVMALFGRIKFDSTAAAELRSSQVSINSVPYFVDGKGRAYDRPLTHIAITDIPVVPGLEPFVALSLSLASTRYTPKPLKTNNLKPKGLKMNLQEMATLLGITVEDGADESTLWELIMTKIQELQSAAAGDGDGDGGGASLSRAERRALAKRTKKLSKKTLAKAKRRFDLGALGEETKEELLEELVDDLPPENVLAIVEDIISAEDINDMLDPMAFANEEDDDDDPKKKKSDESVMSLSLQKKVAKLTMESRAHTIRELVRDGRITPAVAKDLVQEFCTAKSALQAQSDIIFSKQVGLLNKLPRTRTEETLTGLQNPGMADEEKQAMAIALGNTVTTAKPKDGNIY